MQGERVGSSYRLVERIGRGGMGEVWRAEGPRGEVAIKVLHAAFADDPVIVSRFIQERRILMNLRSPHLVEVIDLVAEGDRLAIVMELVRGPDLRRVLRDRRTLRPAMAVRIARQMLDGVTVAHAAGVVHRDLKPENVLLGPDPDAPDVRVVDFGVARITAAGAATNATGLVGTPRYLAPEMAKGETVGPPADVYAVGVVLYEMLFGRAVFDGETPIAIMRAHEVDAPRRPDGVPRSLWRPIAAMLAKDPRRRPTAAEAERALAAVEGGITALDAYPPFDRVVDDSMPTTVGDSGRTAATRPGRRSAGTVTVEAPRPQRSRRRWYVAGAAVIVAAAVTVGWLAFGRDHGSTKVVRPAHCLGGHRVVAGPLLLTDGVLVGHPDGKGGFDHAGMAFDGVFIGFPRNEYGAMTRGGVIGGSTTPVPIQDLATYNGLPRFAPDLTAFREWTKRPGEAAVRMYVAAGEAMLPVDAASLRRSGIDPDRLTEVPRYAFDSSTYRVPQPGTLLRVAGNPQTYLVEGRHRRAVPAEWLCATPTVVTVPDAPGVLDGIPLAPS